ncbi:Uma2 family endonuclease [Rhodospira trueperi]|uniref:Endonuclease, Uma2 family (Restriction endonuclease fold) n=1 Tax=Rhodospira trueperi TaxID=69960 RepID=A0A1G7B5B9_9PROT|nr:Uma2 family endonuclease [Rhodospira trueperi]SDE22221.1 Endonuclease, Uma2 family (restriction endonuclease fold) [Rhodospira trueperi]
MSVPEQAGSIMSRAAFLRWAEEREGRAERVEGRAVAMAPERRAHVRVKQSLWRALSDALDAAGSPCEAFVDGLTVEIGEDGDFVPDVLVDCGAGGPDDVAAVNPLVVVEVLSPGSARVDTGYKLTGYFSVDSIHHYLVVDPLGRRLVHHARAGDGTLRTTILSEGRLRLDPPGCDISVGDLFRA